ncbi:MAG: type II toxin-antitoxin system VapC family toxin [Anaerolineae bacterium]|nr:type II toxin-antitoxin system VapC family toxin [Anaerolineae bacterium]
MILLDTHIWVWWVSRSHSLSSNLERKIQQYQTNGFAVSIISCWEVAKLVELGKLSLTLPVLDWLNQAIVYPGVRLLQLDVAVVVEATQLPGDFHRDPADQILVATARIYNFPILTADRKILDYPHVQKA